MKKESILTALHTVTKPLFARDNSIKDEVLQMYENSTTAEEVVEKINDKYGHLINFLEKSSVSNERSRTEKHQRAVRGWLMFFGILVIIGIVSTIVMIGSMIA